MIRSLAELPSEVGQTLPGEIVLWCPPLGTPVDQRCGDCCDWWTPIFAMWGRPREENLAFHSEEWILWHVHVIQHQRLGVVVS